MGLLFSLFFIILITSSVRQVQSNPRNISTEHSNIACAPFLDGSPCKCFSPYYRGISKCEDERAFILHGYWAGVCGNDSLCTANCPLGFCTYNGSRAREHKLPARRSELNDFICGPTRTGVLCGKCRANYSASYHSYTYTCVPSHSCKYGWLLYIVSELVPLTIVFFLVTAFNISFTSGAINGFILFAQLQDSLQIQGGGIIHGLHHHQSVWMSASQLVYRFFNLEFFSIEHLSFCLWEGATVLDATAFKYVTVLCGLVFMYCSVYVVSSSRVKKCFGCLRPTTLRATMVNGLSAFFVMCYSQTARVSAYILNGTKILSWNHHYYESKIIVFWSGYLQMFEPEHLKYAIPAIIISLTFLLVPPIVLILYPLLCKTLGRCNLSETRCVTCTSRLVPVQLLDSFQSCFKDEYRFFAGLYFLYRLVTLVIFSTTPNIGDFYATIQILLIIMLAVHAIVQPYKKRIHNVVDGFLLTNLVTINALSFSNYQRVIQRITNHGHVFEISSLIQLILIYTPLMTLLIMGLVKVARVMIRQYRKTRQASVQLLTDSCSLPPLREM